MTPHVFRRRGESRIFRAGVGAYRRLTSAGVDVIGEPIFDRDIPYR